MSQDTMFNVLDSVNGDDLIPVVPVRGASDPAQLGSATDGKYYGRASDVGGGSSIYEEITSGADPVAASTRGTTVVNTGNTKGQEIVTLADASFAGQLKRLVINFSTTLDQVRVQFSDLTFADFFPGPGTQYFAVVEFQWLAFGAGDLFWKLTMGGPTILSGSLIIKNNGDIQLFDTGAVIMHNNGFIVMQGKTSDPAQAGELWADPLADFVVKQSQG